MHRGEAYREKKRRPSENGGRDWSYAIHGTTRNGRGKEGFSGAFGGIVKVQNCGKINFSYF